MAPLRVLLVVDDDDNRELMAEVLAGAALHEDPKVQARVQQAIDALNARQASYATIKKFAIVPNDFTQATGELTPTLKVKRKVVTKKYQALLDAFYVE